MDSLKGRDFLRIGDWSPDELVAVLDLADRLKDERKRYVDEPLLPGRSVGSRSRPCGRESRSSSPSSSSAATPCI
jgi:ornithine carbamoyltransferase